MITLKRMPLMVLMAVIVIVSNSACGPVTTTQTLHRAEKSIGKAEVAGAKSGDDQSAYHYWKAKAYYNKAQEEEGFSEYQHAVEFARKADIESVKAVEAVGQERNDATTKKQRKAIKKKKKKKKTKVKQSSEDDLFGEDGNE